MIVSAPAPQAADLIEQSSERGARVAAMRRTAYEPAVMIIAGFSIDEPAILEPFEVSAPFMRVTAESAKGRGATGGLVPIVARIEPGRSTALLDACDADILAEAVPVLRSLCGADADPAWVQVKRWRYATLPAPLDPREVNPPGSRIVVCGDAIAAGGLADVYASGLEAAARVVSELAA